MCMISKEGFEGSLGIWKGICDPRVRARDVGRPILTYVRVRSKSALLSLRIDRSRFLIEFFFDTW